MGADSYCRGRSGIIRTNSIAPNVLIRAPNISAVWVGRRNRLRSRISRREQMVR